MASGGGEIHIQLTPPVTTSTSAKTANLMRNRIRANANVAPADPVLVDHRAALQDEIESRRHVPCLWLLLARCVRLT